MTKNRKTLVLLDAHAIIHRAYHALPDFTSSSGEPTGALYGLSNMLMKIIADLKPDYIAACYDLPGKTFRHEVYEDYKGKRAKTDDALIAQLIKSREIFEAFNIPVYDAPGFEADDILGTIVAKRKDLNGTRVIIATGDMDALQLVDSERVQVYTLKKGINDTILYDEEKVRERFGFAPEFLPDYKGLRGDPSDNIIGVKGIGEKTATALINKFGTIEKMYKSLEKGDEDFKEIGLTDRLINLLRENEEEAMFSKTLAKIRADAPVDFELPGKTFWESADPAKMENLFVALEFRSLVSRLKSFFYKNGGESVTQKFDFGEKEAEIDEGKLTEAGIALWLINSDLPSPALEDILRFAKTKDFDQAYAQVFKILKEKNLEKVYEEIELPIVGLVRKMQERGILIDRDYFKKLSGEYHKTLEDLSAKIFQMAGGEFNINSPKQLGEVLFDRLGIKGKGKKTAGGARSTRIDVLEDLEEGNPIITEIMKYRELQKLLSTYIDVIPNLVGPDGRLHAKFIQNGTTTGRFSSQDPNMQNLPIKSELGRRIRGGFVAEEGHELVAFDYSQIELRILTILSGDVDLTRIFADKKDVHAGVASFVFGVPIGDVDKEMRRQAKVINFGIIYGMGVNALRKNLGGTREEAQRFYDNYFRQFGRVREYLDEVKAFAAKEGYTETLFGRRRYFPNINSRIPFLRSMAERTAINAPIQGTAADIIKLAIRYADEDLTKAGLSAHTHLVSQIHDELVYEVEKSALKEATEIIKNAMEGVLARSFINFKTNIPLSVNFGTGKNLQELK